MRHRHRRGKAGKGSAESARGIALDNQQARPVGEQRSDRPRDSAGVGVRIAMAGAVKLDPVVGAQSVVGRAQRVLAGEDQTRRKAAAAERGRDRRKLDGFWTGPDNDVDTRTGQPSP